MTCACSLCLLFSKPAFPGIPAVFVATALGATSWRFAAINHESLLRSFEVSANQDELSISLRLRSDDKNVSRAFAEYLERRGFGLEDPFPVIYFGQASACGPHNLRVAFEILAHENSVPEPHRSQICRIVNTGKWDSTLPKLSKL
jgi:hypothetical protein